jgi:hypothetical protein
MIALLAALLLTSFDPAQDKQDPVQAADARERADGARRKCAGLVAGTDGLSTIGMAGSGTEYRLLLVVRDPAVKKTLQDRLGGDQLDGIPILWSVRNATAVAQPPAPPAAAAPEPEAPVVEIDDSTMLDYRGRRRWERPEWWGKPRVVWVWTGRGWNGHKIRKSYWVNYCYPRYWYR